jgi:hypothetical protein
MSRVSETEFVAIPACGVSGLSPWPTVAAVPVWALSSLGMCLCGHLDAVALMFTLGSTGLAWWGFCLKEKRWGRRVFVFGMVVVTMVTLGKNVADVVWFGHPALF